jgi:hypothetical protein
MEAYFRDAAGLRLEADAKRAAMPGDEEAGDAKDDDG